MCYNKTQLLQYYSEISEGKMYYIGIDLGGTTIGGALADSSGKLLETKLIPTNMPRPAEAVCSDIAALCISLCASAGVKMEEVGAVGVGSPGVIHDGIVERATHLSFENVPLAAILEEMLHKKIYLLNDGNAAAYGEFIAGAGKGLSSLLMLTIGTGIGGGMIIDGKIYSGFNGASAEMGHLVIDASGRPCRCGKRGCFERYCSAVALIDDTKTAMRENPESLMWELCGGNLDAVDGHTPFDAAEKGDPAAANVVDNFMKYLSIGVSNLVSLMQPQVLCIGGGISARGDAITIPLNRYVTAQSYIHDADRRTKILAGKLANLAGVIGAAMFAKEELQSETLQ